MEKGKDPSDTEPDNDIDQSESDENEHTPPLAYEEELTVLPLDVQINEEEDSSQQTETCWKVNALQQSQYILNLQKENKFSEIKIDALQEEYSEDQFNHFLQPVTKQVETEKDKAMEEEEEINDGYFPMKPKRKGKRKSDTTITCQKCGATFKYKSTYDYHMKSKCGSRMIVGGNKLVKKHKKAMFTCNVCKKELGSRTSLMVHMRLHTGERPFTCDTCGRAFTQKVHMKDHMKVHKNGELSQQQVFFCAECDYECGDKQLLRSHLRVHFGDKLFECSVCSKRFRTYSNLSNHRIIHSDKKDFVCSICGKEFLRKPSLVDHMKTHTKEKPFACDICGKEFSDRTRRNTHVKRHTGELTQQCADCGRKFAAAYDLRIHRRKHTGEKPYACPICGRMFNRKAIMDTHMTIHTGRKDYKCSQCDEAFNRKSKLDIHIAVTHSEDIFRCTICKRVFKCKSYLIPHMKTHMGTSRKRSRRALRASALAADFCSQILVEAVDFNNKQMPILPQVENIPGNFPANPKEVTNGSSTESQEEDLENAIASMNNNGVDAKISVQTLNEDFLLKPQPLDDLSQPVEPIIYIKVENDC